MSSPPTTLGKYQIIREIARSNDIVYEAYDPLMNRRVAVKELAMPSGSTSQQREERINRFKREARAAGTLAHPNIMTVYELGEEGDRFFIAMEYLDGCSLRNELDTKGKIPLDRAMEIELAILKGLEFAHSKGVIHRDIKPDNIQLLSDGRIKLTDFGIARLTFEPNLTMDGQVFGTPSYMSPEQVVGRDIDARSDLFSAGIVFYEMLAGRKPFAGDSVVSITYAIMNKEPEQIQEANYNLWQVIERSLDKSPALRYSSATEMIAALEQAQRSSATGVIDPVFGSNAPQQQSPYGANPYGGPPPIGHPGMGGQVVNTPTPPPVMYAYNPYASSSPLGSNTGMGGQATAGYGPTQYGQSAYGIQSGQNYNPANYSASNLNSPYVPNPTGLPIYYPPPPRQPLISAETKQFWGKLFLAILVIGTLLMLTVVVIKSVSASIGRAEVWQHDRQTVAELNDDLKTLNPKDQLKKIEEIRPEIKSDIGKEEATTLEAEAQRKLGESYYQDRDYAMAEEAIKTSLDLNPEDAEAHRDLATVYEAIAEDRAYAQQSMMFWNKSVQSWINATQSERDPGRRNSFADSATKASIQYAGKLIDMGDYATAQASLQQIAGFARPGTAAATQVSRLMEKIRTSSGH